MNRSLKSSRGRKPHRNLSHRQRNRIAKEIKGNLLKLQAHNAGETSHSVGRDVSKRNNPQSINGLSVRDAGAVPFFGPSFTDQVDNSYDTDTDDQSYLNDITGTSSGRLLDSISLSIPGSYQESDLHNGHGFFYHDDSNDTGENSLNSPNESCSSDTSISVEESEDETNVELDNSRTVVTFRDKLASCFVDNNLTNNAIDNILKVLRLNKSLSYLPKCARTLLGTPRRPALLTDVAPGSYLHLGVQSAIVEILRNSDPNSIPAVLQVDTSTDGVSMDNSGNAQLWPIQCRIFNIEESRVEIIGIYRGKGKPDNAVEFFHHFTEEANRIIADGGVIFNGRKIRIILRCFIADAPARALMMNHMGHNSQCPCSKCKVRGVARDRRLIYPGIDHAPRTDDEYIRMVDEDHHKDGISPLSLLPIGMVSQVPFEYMHLVCLGTVKRLLSAWVHGKFSRLSKLSARQIQLISARLEHLQDFCPQEFARRPRKLEDYHRYKATECRQFLLYTGPVVLYGILNDDLYKHFLLLHAAMRILVTDNPSEQGLMFANLALRTFVARSEILYGPTFLSYNTHGLLHIVEDVKLLGPLDGYSAFPYENNMSIFKRYCRKPDLPLQQIANRRAERANMIALAKPRRSVPILAADPHTTGPLPMDSDPNSRQYRRLKTPKFTLNRTKRDRCCILKNHEIVVIRNVIVIGIDHYLVVQKFRIVESFYDVGIPSTTVRYYKCSSLNSQLSLVVFTEVATKGYLMPYWDSTTVDQDDGEQPVVESFIVASMSTSVNY